LTGDIEKYGEVRISTDEYGELAISNRFSLFFFVQRRKKNFFSLQRSVARTGSVIAIRSVQIRTNPYKK
jgi:hypothetical protein